MIVFKTTFIPTKVINQKYFSYRTDQK